MNIIFLGSKWLALDRWILLKIKLIGKHFRFYGILALKTYRWCYKLIRVIKRIVWEKPKLKRSNIKLKSIQFRDLGLKDRRTTSLKSIVKKRRWKKSKKDDRVMIWGYSLGDY